MSALSEEQRAAVDLACKHRISLISGPPGSGKTRLIAAICEKFPNVLLLAPTGTASERLSACCPNHKAWVIEKVLCDANAKQFSNRPTIVDEAGMPSTDTLEQIFRKIIPSRLVLVGDAKQINCMDGGFSALHTLMKNERIPRTVLTKRWRREGKPPAALDTFLETLGTDQFDVTNQDETFRIVQCDTEVQCYVKAAAEYKLKPSQMLAYTTKAVDKLNELTESQTAEVVYGRARVGDRVVCTENLYDPVTKNLSVANGTCGTAYGDRVKYDNGYVDKLRTRFVPCRCSTVHKSQGNEYDVCGVVVVSPWKGAPPLELMYTAVSRFKSSVKVFVRKTDVRLVFVNSKFNAVPDVELLEEMQALSI